MTATGMLSYNSAEIMECIICIFYVYECSNFVKFSIGDSGDPFCTHTDDFLLLSRQWDTVAYSLTCLKGHLY